MSTGNVLHAIAYMSAIERSEGLVVDDAVRSGSVRSSDIMLGVLVLVLAHGEPEAVQIVDDSLMRSDIS